MPHPNREDLDFDDDSSSSSSPSSYSVISNFSNYTGKNTDSKAGQSDSELRGLEEVVRGSNAVGRWKLAVVIMLSVTAGLVVSSSYIFLSRATEDEFRKSFDQSAQTIMDAAEFTARNNIQMHKTLADMLTAESMAVNATWPFFTATNFEIAASHARLATFAEIVMFTPLVPGMQREEWETYSVQRQDWIGRSQQLAEKTSEWFLAQQTFGRHSNSDQRMMQQHNGMNISQKIFVKAEDNPGGRSGDLQQVPAWRQVHYAPVWQISPPPHDPYLINYNILGDRVSFRLFNAIQASGGQPILSEIIRPSTVEFFSAGVKVKGYTTSDGNATVADTFPRTITMAPIYRSFESDAPTVGYVASMSSWDVYLSRLLPESVKGVVAVLSSTCSQTVTYVINGPDAIYLGDGDRHDRKYDDMKQSLSFEGFGRSTQESRSVGQCDYVLEMYPSSRYHESYDTQRAIIFTLLLALIFFLTAVVFFVFVVYVQKRQEKVMMSAIQTNKIVSSLFPSNVRDRMIDEAKQSQALEVKRANFVANKDQDIVDDTNVFSSKPIADLFPETTVMFSDLVGFTAWSSAREPSQVFTLLETVYHAFDEIANRRRIFKVETVGDCYVAAAGIPDPRKDHAVLMARFATECKEKLNSLVKKLELKLGPDTGDLSMRFGLHSGPVTGGVLRGERARFQLFGDTMNTASRIESLGQAGRIHVSSETAQLLIAAGRARWVKQRTDRVMAKGKGELVTYWLEVHGKEDSSSRSGSVEEPQPDLAQHSDVAESLSVLDEKTARLVEWNADLLLRMLRQIAARRRALNVIPSSSPPKWKRAKDLVIDEVKEIVHLPTFEARVAKEEINIDSINLGELVEEELKSFLTAIATLYRNNPFHNFEHASHVTMSVVKLLSRIVSPKIDATTDVTAAVLHDHTYGITSDPLTQFACVFSALIHDVDHRGIPNVHLADEEKGMAAHYNRKSIAEQNSVDIAWDLLMDDQFRNLQHAIFVNEEELERFRELVVNSVMATDIMDKDLKALRNARWDKAFAEGSDVVSESRKDAIDRKATIVIEHLIQASDVAHTMQHWHIYRKWNTRLFMEMYKAYKQGRSTVDPSETWYQGEIGFFDFYIIPLAKKLKDCGVFGVSSYEYLSYAERNRDEWEAKGKDVVTEMMESIRRGGVLE